MRKITINTPLVVSVAFIAAAAIMILLQLPPLLGAMFTPRPAADPTQPRLALYLAGHDDNQVTYRARFDGRSLFFKPQPKRRPPPPPPTRDDTVERPPPPLPPVDRTYKGPSVRFVLGDEVWFHDGVKVRVGDEGSNGVTVIESNPPWSLKLGHGGGEFDIELFERSFPGLAEEAETPRPLAGLVQVVNENEEEEETLGDEGAALSDP
ncbi:MAG: hypothetical protein ACYSU7_11455 [Planctomycetota bacterium]